MINKHHKYAIKTMLKGAAITSVLLGGAILIVNYNPGLLILIGFLAVMWIIYGGLYDYSKLTNGDKND